MHELKIKNSLEMKTYKILREFSERESLKLLKINNKYELGKDKVEIIDGKHLRINGELVAINLLREKLEKRWISERDFI